MFKIFLFFVNKISFKSAQMYIKPRHINHINKIWFAFCLFLFQNSEVLTAQKVYGLLSTRYVLLFYFWVKFTIRIFVLLFVIEIQVWKDYSGKLFC